MLSRCAKSSASHDSTFPQSSRKNWTGSWGIQGDFGLVGIILIRPLNILLFAGVEIIHNHENRERRTSSWYDMCLNRRWGVYRDNLIRHDLFSGWVLAQPGLLLGGQLRLDLINGLNGKKLYIFGSFSILKCFLAGSKQKITQGVSMKDAKIQINLCIYAWSVDYSIVLKYIVSCLFLFLFIFFTFKKYKYKGNPCQFFFRQWHTGLRESLYFGHFFRRPPPTPYLEGR